ncbi:MAG TPA: hypothetical protein VIT19_01065 [Pyrinomonadaceae bacterium]
MKNLRRLGPALVLGLTIALAGVSFAQSTKQATSDDKHSCCCMSSEGCGDSCQMKKKEGAKNHVTTNTEGCCGCCGDSCQMMKKEGAKNHATSNAKGCCGDSCQMKGSATATAKADSDKHQCCCGDSCNMKHMKHTKDMKGKS